MSKPLDQKEIDEMVRQFNQNGNKEYIKEAVLMYMYDYSHLSDDHPPTPMLEYDFEGKRYYLFKDHSFYVKGKEPEIFERMEDFMEYEFKRPNTFN